MIMLTRLDGVPFALNPDLIERVEAPVSLHESGAAGAQSTGTVITLVGGTPYVVEESLDDLLAKVREFRSQVIARASVLDHEYQQDPSSDVRPGHPETVPAGDRPSPLRVVTTPD